MVMLMLSLLLIALTCGLSAVYASDVSSTTASRDAATTVRIVSRGNLSRNRRLRGLDNNKDDDDDDDDFKAPVVGSITGLLLMNSNIDISIRKVINATQYNVYNYPTLNLNMQILTNGTVGSVLMVYSHSNISGTFTRSGYIRIDSAAPFSLCGDTIKTVDTMNATDYDTCSFLSNEGNHRIIAVPFMNSDATGRRGQPYTTTFRVLNTDAEERKCEVPKVRCNEFRLLRKSTF